MTAALVEQIRQATIDGQAKIVPSLVQQALDKGAAIEDLINNGFVSAMAAVGEQFSQGKIFVPEMCLPRGQ